MSSAAELIVNRRNTAAFIAADAVSLSLIPTERSRTAAGGFRDVAGQARSPQTFRLIPGNDRMPEVKTSNGRLTTPTYILLGTWDCAMAQWDTFVHNGATYEVVAVHPEHTANRYEIKGDVVVKDRSE